VLKDKSNVTRSPKRQEVTPVVLGSAKARTATGTGARTDTITTLGGTKIQRLFPASSASVGISRQDITHGGHPFMVRSDSAGRHLFENPADFEICPDAAREVAAVIDSQEHLAQGSTANVPSKKSRSQNPGKGKGDLDGKGTRVASKRATTNQARQSPAQTVPSVHILLFLH
jgi:hypothetical protein